MEQNEKLGQSEYEETLLDHISKVVINRNYIENNIEFWNNVCFKLFEEYYYSKENVSISSQARLLEVVLSNMFRFKPSQELPEDILFL